MAHYLQTRICPPSRELSSHTHMRTAMAVFLTSQVTTRRNPSLFLEMTPHRHVTASQAFAHMELEINLRDAVLSAVHQVSDCKPEFQPWTAGHRLQLWHYRLRTLLAVRASSFWSASRIWHAWRRRCISSIDYTIGVDSWRRRLFAEIKGHCSQAGVRAEVGDL